MSITTRAQNKPFKNVEFHQIKSIKLYQMKIEKLSAFIMMTENKLTVSNMHCMLSKFITYVHL